MFTVIELEPIPVHSLYRDGERHVVERWAVWDGWDDQPAGVFYVQREALEHAALMEYWRQYTSRRVYTKNGRKRDKRGRYVAGG